MIELRSTKLRPFLGKRRESLSVAQSNEELFWRGYWAAIAMNA